MRSDSGYYIPTTVRTTSHRLWEFYMQHIRNERQEKRRTFEIERERERGERVSGVCNLERQFLFVFSRLTAALDCCSSNSSSNNNNNSLVTTFVLKRCTTK